MQSFKNLEQIVISTADDNRQNLLKKENNEFEDLTMRFDSHCGGEADTSCDGAAELKLQITFCFLFFVIWNNIQENSVKISLPINIVLQLGIW
ncbi:Hypothetical predicted protein [Octopus vulgaris]|uniref:Uncharacterized protein n=1 Tax=Octopus vulgaris TaxID=6645 RepID=A0AA36BSE7_OCTVU|nr:Hypothetical predicted protein [Octopus vulgaris]